MNWSRWICAALAAGLGTTLVAPAALASPPRPSFREPKADFDDKELALTYAFGPGAADFAVTSNLSLGLSVDQVFGAQDWYYRVTYKLVDNPAQGLDIALNLGALQTREQLAGNQYNPPVWGYQGGLLLSFASDSGLILRAGLQLYNTDWHQSGGQQLLLTPEVAYRYGIGEISLQPGWPLWPLTPSNMSWVGLRLRI